MFYEFLKYVLFFLYLLISPSIQLIDITTSSVKPFNRHLRSQDYVENQNQMQVILEAFRVNTDTIIRTQDSRALGARYINETDFSTNQKCLIWCWETPQCNVAVFEDKEDHKSCYLFDCGNPKNFRCLFTGHVGYVSSVLQVSRHPHDLETWRQQHESDLHQLQTPSSTIPPPTTKPPTPRPTESACKVYQFKCANSSDCIAIYNVCDGIPQCPDGSDEGEEMHCRHQEEEARTSTAPPTTESPKIAPPTPPSPVLTPPMPYPPPGLSEADDRQSPSPTQDVPPRSNWVPQAPPPSDVDYSRNIMPPSGPQVFTHKHSDFVAAANSGYNHWSPEYYDPGYNNPGSRYYQPNRPPVYQHPSPPEPLYYPPPRERVEPLPQRQDSLRYQWSAAAAGEAPPPPQQQQPQQQQAYYPAAQRGGAGDYRWGESNKNGGGVSEEEELYQPVVELPSTSSPPPTTSPAPTPSPTLSPQAKALSLLHTHPANTNGAVLALLLGVCVISVFGLLVACRISSLRHRLSRKRRSLVHDADYLVNGMYL